MAHGEARIEMVREDLKLFSEMEALKKGSVGAASDIQWKCDDG